MKAKLTIGDRFNMLGLLPSIGNFATLKVIRKLREQLSLSDVELKSHNVVQKGEQITWSEGAKTTEMEFGDFAEAEIVNALKKLNNEKKLDEKRHFHLYEIFVDRND